MSAVPFALALLAGTPEPALTARLEQLPPPAAIAGSQRKLLDSRALVVRSGSATRMRVWFRREIPVRATAEQFPKGLTYRHIPEGTLVGAIELLGTFTDYRRQRLPRGVYTLRFALQPDTGDHTDTAPHREFFLLSPAADDPSPAPIQTKRLIELSSQVNEGRHPAVLLLWPHEERNPAIQVLDKGKGVWVAAVRRPVADGNRRGSLGFALTISGSWSQ